jgi:hypothetical protein
MSTKDKRRIDAKIAYGTGLYERYFTASDGDFDVPPRLEPYKDFIFDHLVEITKRVYNKWDKVSRINIEKALIERQDAYLRQLLILEENATDEELVTYFGY